VNQIIEKPEGDFKSFHEKMGKFKKSLEVFESHLKLRNFLVGYSMTLADVLVAAHLILPFQLFLDAATRKETIPNLTRYAKIIYKSP
jgi:glutathione S-transferase